MVYFTFLNHQMVFVYSCLKFDFLQFDFKLIKNPCTVKKGFH